MQRGTHFEGTLTFQHLLFTKKLGKLETKNRKIETRKNRVRKNGCVCVRDRERDRQTDRDRKQ